MADPQAMLQASAAAQITQLVGLPEALYALSQVTIYLAKAPKSNAVKRAYFAALEDAAATAREPVPYHLRNAVTPLMKSAGYGQGYRYVHDDPQAREGVSGIAHCRGNSTRLRKRIVGRRGRACRRAAGDHCAP